jgi:hypothetical protein
MTFYEQLENGYLDVFGLVSPAYKGGSTNGVMYTSEAAVIADRIGQLDKTFITFWNDVIAPCEMSPGLISRTPAKTGEEAPDDYYGYLAGAKRCDQAKARAFLWHGITHAGFYNSDGKLAWSDFLWRQPQLITHALWAAGLWAGPFRIFFIASLLFAIYQNHPASDTDARRIGWLLIQNWDGKGIVSKWAVKKWQAWLMTAYPETGMRGVAAVYYGPNHPFITNIPIF